MAYTTPYYPQGGFEPDYSTAAPKGYDINAHQYEGINTSPITDQVTGQGNTGMWNPGAPNGGINYGAAAAGAASFAGDAIAQAHQRLGLPVYNQSLQYSNGRPSYSGDQWNTAIHARPRSAKLTGENAGNLLGATTKGFGAGFSAGGLYGAFIGGSIGTFTNSAGPVGAIHNKQQHEKDVALLQAKAYQQNYNTASQSADQLENSQSDYSRRLGNTRRFANLYRLPSQYQI